MTKAFSSYLDAMRFLAALAVVVSHVSWKNLSGGFLWQIQFIGHDAVIVFFVLSGYVISYAAETKEKSLVEYEVARFARLYSVVIPAILLTYICDQIGIHHNSSVYNLSYETQPLLRSVAGVLFLTQSWGWGLSLFNNNAYWSLPYEFWYYQLFAAAFFLRGGARIAMLLICSVIAGTILIYLPLWLLGTVAYRLSAWLKPRIGAARIVFIGTIACLLAILVADQTGHIARSGTQFLPPSFSPIDYLIGIVIAGNLYAASFLQLPLARASRTITKCAGITFALYLFHMPLLHLEAAYLPAGIPVALRGIIMLIVTIAVVVALTPITEGRKHAWKSLFRLLLNRRAPGKAAQTG